MENQSQFNRLIRNLESSKCKAHVIILGTKHIGGAKIKAAKLKSKCVVHLVILHLLTY
jgi:hypothetical protein